MPRLLSNLRELAVALGVLCLVFGYAGYAELDLVRRADVGPPLIEASNRFYRTIQLFILEASFEPGDQVGWKLQFARIVAPLATGSLLATYLEPVFTALSKLYVSWVWRRHAIVGGLGELGRSLCIDLRRYGYSVVALDTDLDAPTADELRRSGVLVLEGDARNPSLLRELGIRRAGYVFLTLGDDDLNATASLAAHGALAGAADRDEPVILCPHLEDPQVRTLLRRRMHFDDPPKLETRDFDFHELAARQLLHSAPLDRTRVVGPHQPRVHLVVVGCGRMGMAVVMQAIRTCRYRDERPLRVTLFGRDAGQCRRALEGRYPALLGKHMPIRIVDLHHVDGEMIDEDRAQRLAEIVTREDEQVTIVVALDSDASALDVVEHFPPEVRDVDVPIHVRVRGQGGIANLVRFAADIDPSGGPLGLERRIRPFGTPARVVRAKEVISARRDQLARAIHAGYVSHQDRCEPDPRPQCAPWERLDESYRISNRQAADFVHTLARSCGYEIVERDCLAGRPPVEGPDQGDLEVMAELEHVRWCIDRALSGWRLGEERSDERLLHPDLVTWADLAEDRRAIDRTQVATLFETLLRETDGVPPVFMVRLAEPGPVPAAPAPGTEA